MLHIKTLLKVTISTIEVSYDKYKHHRYANITTVRYDDDDKFRFNNASTHENHLRQNGTFTLFSTETAQELIRGEQPTPILHPYRQLFSQFYLMVEGRMFTVISKYFSKVINVRC